MSTEETRGTVLAYLNQVLLPGKAEEWMERKIPAFLDLTPGEYAARYGWDDVMYQLRKLFAYGGGE